MGWHVYMFLNRYGLADSEDLIRLLLNNLIRVCIVSLLHLHHLSRVVRKLAFCVCENKATDQLCGNLTADQRLCFRYMDSTIPLFSKSEISSLYLPSVAVQPGLCQTWSETRKTGFLTTRLIWMNCSIVD